MIELDNINKTTWALKNPMDWAQRYSNRVTLATPLFIEIDSTVPNAARARLLDINGGADPDWSPLSKFVNQEDDTENGQHGVSVDSGDLSLIKQAFSQGAAAAACLMIASMSERWGGQWEELADALEADRYEPNAWFERDNRQLTLLDLFSNTYVVELQDGEVDDAIESGYLNRPKLIRPSDADWAAPLLEYARSQGQGLSLQDILHKARTSGPDEALNTPESPRPAAQ